MHPCGTARCTGGTVHSLAAAVRPGHRPCRLGPGQCDVRAMFRLCGTLRHTHMQRIPLTCSAGSNHARRTGQVIVIDNYDSFTYNLCQYLGDLSCDYLVLTNDEMTVDEVRELEPRGILVSPGPGRPEDSGISLAVVRELGPSIPLFGVCMGHQCIGEVFGGNVVRAPCGVMHGKASPVHHNNTGLLQGLPNPFHAARYHSLVIDKDTCPDDLEVTAWTEDGTIMGVRHKQFPNLEGVQFHPESIITDSGKTIVQNFIDRLG